MKFSAATFLVLLPLVSEAVAVSVPRPRLSLRQEDFNSRGRHGNGGRNGIKNSKNSNNRAAQTSSGASAVGNTTVASNSTAAAGSNSTVAAAGSGDPQTSLTLDPRVIAKGFANDGQDVPAAGQVASLTSTNNFINFCLTVPNLPITDGKQITAGSCNPAPIGTIPSIDKMPSAKFTFPVNGGTVTANQQFTIQMAINNLATGNFVNADENYFAAPQQLDNQGLIIGHSHVVVETVSSTAQTTPTDPRNFAFFKGLNEAAVNGVLSADVTAGLPAGAYRLCSINTCANHQPAIVPVAQHGSLDDCVYFSATADGAASNATAAVAAGAAGNATAAVAAGAAGNATAATAAAAGTSAAGAAGNATAVNSVVAGTSIAGAAKTSAASAAASATAKSSKFNKERRHLSRL